ncbi:MAG: twin-arginine translocation pathway signal protein [Roseitalea sp.]|jgi:hypothetical protein|nr:twin-arginine translocation pathway signal protein [Roseitalea sp.]MBO6721939.1 twin-arginine translocation pathway signal protein [Roseitalea sp.]MBO6743110.1 twin-arginine translocation pathway signal protein [Roseitalea sp.]
MSSLDRRKFLMLACGGVIVAAGASAGVFGATRTPTRALEPWERAGAPAYADPRMRALSYAILAPNPHNRQPWTVALEGEDTVRIGFDEARQLPHTDPFDRQLTIGMGCFIELMAMAAADHGYRVDLDLFPDGVAADGLDARPVAMARFAHAPGIAVDPLFAHVLQRRSMKEAHDATRPVPQSAIDVLAAACRNVSGVGGTAAESELGYWRDLTMRAMEIEFDTPRTLKESVDLFRIGKREINANPDGIELPGAGFEIMNRLGLLTRENTLDPQSMAFTQGKASTLAPLATSMGYVWTKTRGNSRPEQIGAGRDWVRMNLAATGLGLGFHPNSQALQEFDEMKAVYGEVHRKLAPEGGTVQMLTRIGYGPQAGPTPRWPLESRIVEGA